jgi:hypothetical protein
VRGSILSCTTGRAAVRQVSERVRRFPDLPFFGDRFAAWIPAAYRFSAAVA